jgi:hypothetical protein
MVRQLAGVFCCMTLMVAGCAHLPSGNARIELTGSDDNAAAVELTARLRAAGVPVEPASSPSSLFVYRAGRATLLSPVLQSDGLDRIIGTRSYAPAAGQGEQALRSLAAALNERLNVASFKVAGGALLMEANLTFLDRLAVEEVLAFLDWLDAIELAIGRVDEDGRVLLLSAGGP